ncbi:GH35 family endo-1,4-beta-xylanase [Actinomadura coerulea]|uniref:GH35 family endo-1,4-beta-xylanase n=1 Tax=Actinomadura coerulea TaxID=46159 RepID=A0A7X0L024_9ACTN|nr:endo-1,4-beta-xylanase [Actinomadura coerulea]MBB6397083.1 GH35 family endo-1,4-beta-xylanase [Actinomadura coerulea]
MGESACASTLDREFNQLTPENEMKWDTTEPSRNSFDFDAADSSSATHRHRA